MHILSRKWCQGLLIAGTCVAAVLWGAAYVWSSMLVTEVEAYPPVRGVEQLANGFRIDTVRIFDEEVTALATSSDASSSRRGYVFAGTSPHGSVQRFDPMTHPKVVEMLGMGLGDRLRHGTCNVNAIAIKDLDGDGELDVLASTSQISPRGQPRLYLWSMETKPTPKGFTRPLIDSSWSHGLGFLDDPKTGKTSAFITFCGYGELVEYQFHSEATPKGFMQESLGWKQIDKLPASGEWLQTSDVDNDDEDDLCVATGYAEGKAEILVYGRGAADGSLAIKTRIDESGRFGNVHFIAGDVVGDGTNDIVAWWCDLIDGGDCEMIRYRLGPNGAIERTEMVVALADDMMPRDGQMTFFDLDRDGRMELWFAARGGALWRYDPARSETIQRVLKLQDGIGPVVGLDHPLHNLSGLYIGSGPSVVRLSPNRQD